MIACKLLSTKTIVPYVHPVNGDRLDIEEPTGQNRIGGWNIMRDFRELKVWEKSHKLTLKVYRISKLLPETERYGLVSQLRRASASIPINIAEGCGRKSKRDQAYFMQIAMGSACELEYQLLLVQNLNMLQPEDYKDLNSDVIEVKRMLAALIKYLRGL